MNRKLAVAAIVGGLMHAASLLRGQAPQAPPSRIPRQPLPPDSTPAMAGQTTEQPALTPAMIDDLQRQIAELRKQVEMMQKTQASLTNDYGVLQKRLDGVERTQADSPGFTKVGDNFVFAPPTGKVSIKAPLSLTLEGTTVEVTGGPKVEVKAGGQLIQKAAMIMLN